MAWDDKLDEQQRIAASHFGSHARLLAGPGTGKTHVLARHICFLVEEKDGDVNDILTLTFTRAAAFELRQRIEAELGEEKKPRISTLHSYALRQLLRNTPILIVLPQPIRIADDWEERNIVLEDLKALVGLEDIDKARGLLSDLSSDWQSLLADEQDWERRFPNPSFLGAWQEHREKYGYLLRSELVYQLKKAIEQYDDFNIEGPPHHLLVDEYQDLNRCDLFVVKTIANKGAEIFVAGDDDQSIYGFRKAHPEGIRRFPRDYVGARLLELEVCKRCDSEILKLGLFVAEQDYARLPKLIQVDEGREGGEVAILRFSDQEQEAAGIASLCHQLINDDKLEPHEILMLVRTDRKGVFSSILRDALERARIPVVAATDETNPFNSSEGRKVLAMLRLMVNPKDHLAWRTLLKLRENNLGPGAIEAIYILANSRNARFANALDAIESDPTLLPARFGAKVQREVVKIRELLGDLSPKTENEEEEARPVLETVTQVVDVIIKNQEERRTVVESVTELLQTTEAQSISDLLRGMEASNERIEQEIEQGKVNILTMHKAKGLTVKAVIVVAAEDEYLPGRAVGDDVGDELRLLYVSLTRAKHFLFITYCERRTLRQRYTGRDSGSTRRSPTRFLRDGPMSPFNGLEYISRRRSLRQ